MPRAEISRGGLHEPPAGVDHTQVMRPADPAGGARVLSGIALVALGYLVASQLLLYLGVAVSWLARGRPGDFTSSYQLVIGYHLPEGIAIVDLALASAILVVIGVARWWNGMAPGWLVSVRPGMRWGLLGLCLVIGFVVLNGIYLVGRRGDVGPLVPPSHAWLWILLVVLTAPLQAAGEEFLFRGYLQQAVGALTGRAWVAVPVSALVFAFMHGGQNLPLFVDRFGFGLAAGLMVVFTGGLEASIAVHAANNVSTFCYAILAGTVAQTRAIDRSSWATTGVNVASYVLAGALALLVCRLLRLRTHTRPTPV